MIYNLLVLDSMSKGTNTINDDSNLITVLQEYRWISSISDISRGTRHDNISLFQRGALAEVLNDTRHGVNHGFGRIFLEVLAIQFGCYLDVGTVEDPWTDELRSQRGELV